MPWTSSLMELYAKAYGLESEYRTRHLSITLSSVDHRETKLSFGLVERVNAYKKQLSGARDMVLDLML